MWGIDTLIKTKSVGEVNGRLPNGLKGGKSSQPIPHEQETNYFFIQNITNRENGELYVSGASGKVLEYSTDKATWHELDTTELPEIHPLQKLYLRGTNTNVIGLKLSCTEPFIIGGDITTLLADEGGIKYKTRNVFGGMFNVETYGKNLYDASMLYLPATELTDNAYKEMFKGCENLLYAPLLRATTLASGCYRSIFDGCKSLEVVAVDFTQWGENSETKDWLKDTNQRGTIYNPIALPTPQQRTTDTIPIGWSVIDE